jgi:hypothetical protein
MRFIDKLLETCEARINYSIDQLEKTRWQAIKNYITKTRSLYDKFDDISRINVPMWRKRIILQEIKTCLGHDNYDYLDDFDVLPLIYFENR